MTIDVTELVSHIDGTVLTPGDAGYDESIKRWASNAERKAAVVVLVTSSSDVASAVKPSFKVRSNCSSRMPRKRVWRLQSAGGNILLQQHHPPKGVSLSI
jgi:hypothetical protein